LEDQIAIGMDLAVFQKRHVNAFWPSGAEA